MSKVERTMSQKIDRYLRREDTLLARSLTKITPQVGESYFTGKAKRRLDLGISVPASVVAIPLIGITAGLNKCLSPGDPAFFQHARVGNNGEHINLVKIRSMKPDSDRQETDQTKTAWADPRNTKLGRFIRRCNIDELPQLLQVVRGELSLIGNRPVSLAVQADLSKTWTKDRYDEWKREYGQTPVGLSGVNQVVNYGSKQDGKKFYGDIFYAKHGSLGFDLYLMWKTLGKILRAGRLRNNSQGPQSA